MAKYFVLLIRPALLLRLSLAASPASSMRGGVAAAAEGNSASLQSSSRHPGVKEETAYLPIHSHDQLRKYHTGDAIIKEISALKDSCAVPLELAWQVDTEELPGRSLFVARVGNPHATRRVLIAASEHARELITAEVALRFIADACARGHSDPAARAELFNDVRFTIVPLVNQDGRRLVETGESPCQRTTTNEQGAVDLNRNGDVDWGKAPATSGGEEAPGPHPFSAFQTRVLRDLAAAEKPLSYVDLHSTSTSGGRSLMTSWGFQPATDPDFGDQSKMLETIQRTHCPDCAIGSNRIVIHYPNPGEMIDHMYKKQAIKYSTLWEIYAPSSGRSETDCRLMYNALHDEYDKEVANWASAVEALGRYVLGHVSPSERSSSSSS